MKFEWAFATWLGSCVNTANVRSEVTRRSSTTRWRFGVTSRGGSLAGERRKMPRRGRADGLNGLTPRQQRVIVWKLIDREVPCPSPHP
jgi:hypothetical protein